MLLTRKGFGVQKLTYYGAKGKLLHAETLSFTTRKTTNRDTPHNRIQGQGQDWESPQGYNVFRYDALTTDWG